MHRPLYAALALVFALVGSAFAGGPEHWRNWLTSTHDCCCPPRVGGCPDDYCRKPMPCVPCPKWCGTCDDYCRKPMPCVPCPKWCGTCDDYCPKPLPNYCMPGPPGMVCVPTGCPCQRPAAPAMSAAPRLMPGPVASATEGTAAPRIAR